jgi:hypothetical protein
MKENTTEQTNAEVKRTKLTPGNTPPKDKSMHGGARGGDQNAQEKPDENQEPPIIERTA